MQVCLFYFCIGRDLHDLKFGVVNNETNSVDAFNSSHHLPPGGQIFIWQLNNQTFEKVLS